MEPSPTGGHAVRLPGQHLLLSSSMGLADQDRGRGVLPCWLPLRHIGPDIDWYIKYGFNSNAESRPAFAVSILFMLQTIESMNVAVEKYLKYLKSESSVDHDRAITTGLDIVRLYQSLNDILGKLLSAETFLGVLNVTATAFFGSTLYNVYSNDQFQVC